MMRFHALIRINAQIEKKKINICESMCLFEVLVSEKLSDRRLNQSEDNNKMLKTAIWCGLRTFRYFIIVIILFFLVNNSLHFSTDKCIASVQTIEFCTFVHCSCCCCCYIWLVAITQVDRFRILHYLNFLRWFADISN